MRHIRGILIRIGILLIVLITTSCAASSKHKYKKKKRFKPCDCHIWAKNSEVPSSSTTYITKSGPG